MITRTVCGYDFFEVSSAMQKTIRRADIRVAGSFALGLWASGYRDYVWERLFAIGTEDYSGIITKEIEALWQGHEPVNKIATEPRGRIFVSKAIILFCECRKNRDTDHLRDSIYSRKDIGIEKWTGDVRRYPIPIPDYTFDVHTRKGEKHRRTREELFREEYKVSQPRVPGLFDDLVQSSQPELLNDETTAK